MLSFKEYLKEGKRGLWDNIHAKRERIKHGSGERMRKPGSKGAPSAADFKAAAESFEQHFEVLEEAVAAIDKGEYDYEGQMARTQLQTILRNSKDLIEMLSDEENMPEWVQSKITLAQDYITCVRDYLQSREELGEEFELNEGTADELGDKIDNAESSEHAKSIISKAPTKHLQYLHHWNMGLSGARTHKDMPHIKAELAKRKSLLSGAESAKRFDEELEEDAKGYKNPTGGLTQKGRDHYNNKYGSHLKAPVTTPPSELKPGSKAANRRKSFCARMSGVEGPMKKPNGEPTRKALALRKWNC
jgi:hypothetical protein